ncbi:hypothetical protein HMPREF0185_02516 [Brevundimonas diminuta 470-4]|nr:hypothetical protein HMPREF0185_02516 [Brevundimonas diminuta 470-4]
MIGELMKSVEHETPTAAPADAERRSYRMMRCKKDRRAAFRQR